MATSTATLSAKITANADQFKAEMVRAGKYANDWAGKTERSFSRVGQRIGRNLSGGLGQLTAALSIGALVGFGKSVLDLGGQITDLSNQAGISTDAFQTFSNIARDSGVSAEQVAQAFVQMRKSIEDAATGSQAQAEALAVLHLKAQALQALAPEMQLEMIARRISQATDKNAAFNAALDILGAKNAPKLAEVLQRLGTEGFGNLSKEVEKMKLSEEQLKTLDDAGDKLERMWTMVKLITAKKFLSVITPYIDTGSDVTNARNLYESNKQSLGENHPITRQNYAELKALEENPAKYFFEKARASSKNAELFDKYMEKAKQYSPKRDVDKKPENSSEVAYNIAENKMQNDPLYQLGEKFKENKKADKNKTYIFDLFTKYNPELSFLGKDLMRVDQSSSMSMAPTDQFSRIGIMNTAIDTRADSEPKKQTEHLKEIIDALKTMNETIKSGKDVSKYTN